MDLLSAFIDMVLHLDQHLLLLTQSYGTWVYLILLAIVYCEPGLVVMPFLPGDSLLFMTGTLVGAEVLEVEVVIAALVAASFLGDNTNYWIGRYLGPKVFRSETSRLLDREHLERTRRFYERHGPKALVLARFFPIIRTFAPFVAGVGRMDYRRFLPYSLAGGVLWVGGLVSAGYFLGGFPMVKENLTLVILGILLISLLPGILAYLRREDPGQPDAAPAGDPPVSGTP